jgi:hypothetical protein
VRRGVPFDDELDTRPAVNAHGRGSEAEVVHEHVDHLQIPLVQVCLEELAVLAVLLLLVRLVVFGDDRQGAVAPTAVGQPGGGVNAPLLFRPLLLPLPALPVPLIDRHHVVAVVRAALGDRPLGGSVVRAGVGGGGVPLSYPLGGARSGSRSQVTPVV